MKIFFKSIIFSLSLFITLTCFSQAKGASPITINDIKTAYQSKQYINTINLGNQYLIANPGDTDAEYLVGYSYYELKDYHKASLMLEMVLSQDPKYNDARYTLIQAEMSQGDYKRALDLVNEGLHYQPNSINLLLKRAQIYMALQQNDKALDDANYILVNEPNFTPARDVINKIKYGNQQAASAATQPLPPLSATADIKKLYQQRQYKQAIDMGNRYVSNNPRDVDVQYFIALSYYQLRDYSNSANTFSAILNKNPQYFDARIGLIDSQMAQGNLVGAFTTVDNGLAIYPDNPDLLYKRALIYAAQKDDAKAMVQAKTILDKNPNHAPARALYNKLFSANKVAAPTDIGLSHPFKTSVQEDIKKSYDQKNYQRSVTLGVPYIAKNPNDLETKYYVGNAYYQLKNYDKAADLFQDILRRKPSYNDARLALAKTNIARGNYNQAMRDLDHPGTKSVEHSPATSVQSAPTQESQPHTIEEGNIIYASNPISKPTRDYVDNMHGITKSGKLIGAPFTNKVTDSEIKAAYRKKQYQRTVTLGEQYMASYPKDVDMEYYVGNAYYQMKQYDKAAVTFKDILKKDPQYNDARIALIQTAIAQHQYDYAHSVVNQGLALEPNNPDLLYKRSQIYAAQKDYQNASITAQRLEQHHPSYQPGGGLTAKLQQVRPRHHTYTPSRPHKPKPAMTLEDIKALVDSNELAAAEHQAKDYLIINPGDTDVRYQLGRTYQKEENYHLARQEFERILTTQPNDMDTKNSLIDTLFSLKEYDDVLYITDTGQNGYPNDQLMVQRAKAWYLLNKDKEAISTLQSISDLNAFEPAKTLYDSINEATNYHYLRYWETGTYDSIMSVKTPEHQTWTLSSVYLNRHTPDGSMGVALRYQTRPGSGPLNGAQYEVNAQPLLTTTTYVQAAYAYSSYINIFPKQMLYGEIFQSFPHSFDASLGDVYRFVQNEKYLNAYTGSIGKYFGNYYLNFRPTRFVPNAGPKSTLYRLGLRRYSDNPDQYIEVFVADGHAPDLADLTSVDFIKLKDSLFFINGQYPLNRQIALQYGLGYERQIFPNHLKRRFTYFNFGLRFRDL